MSARVYFIGDLHLGHDNIINFCRHQFESIQHHDETIVEIWNSIVKPKDVVYVMGDLAFRREKIKYARYLNGNKHIILGNHDDMPIMDYIEAGFSRIEGAFKYKEFILTHVPVHPSCLEFGWKYNIHGHIHDPSKNIDDPRYFNVCADMNNLAPISLEEIRSKIKLKESDFYD